MPSTRIETRAGWIGDRHAELIAAVQRALVEGIRIPDNDRFVRILEYPAHRLRRRPGQGPELLPSSRPRCLPATRARRQASRLYALRWPASSLPSACRFRSQDHHHDVPRENWGLRGQSAAGH